MMQAADLTPLVSPQAVAVVGASRHAGKVGYLVLRNLLAAGYKGLVLPVNATPGEDILGLPALASTRDLPQGLDLAILCLPQEAVLAEMRILAQRGVRAAIVLAAGFRETGRLGFEAEMELKRIAQEAGMALLGPNSLGLINTACGLNASFASGTPARGSVAFFSQSGALCVAVLDWANHMGIGFSRFVSLGNKASLGEAEILRELGADPETKVILGYCESLEDGQEFLAAAREVARCKPVLMLKAGATQAGARAVSSHTGSVSGSPAAYRAAFRQAGIVRVDEIEDLLDLALVFATQPLPGGPGLGVVTNAGGPGILAADACARSRLTMPRPSATTLETLSQALPPFASAFNPVDILGDADDKRYRAALAALAADPQIHAVLTLLTPTAAAKVEATAQAIIDAAASQDPTRPKPFAACLMGGEGVRKGREMLRAARIPSYDFPESAVAALDAMYAHHRRGVEAAEQAQRNATLADQIEAAPWDAEADSIVAEASARGLADICGQTALELVQAAGLPVLTSGLARTSDEALRLASEIGLPVSLRLATPEPGPQDFVWGEPAGDAVGQLHNLADREAVRRGFMTLTTRAALLRPEAYVQGCLVQKTAPRGGHELCAGFVRDPQFGPLLSFGMRGVSADLLDDVAHRLAPLSPSDAREMLREVRVYPLLRGALGAAPVPLEALERLLLLLARLALRLPGLAAAEFSPVLAGPTGAFIAGARLTLNA